MLGVGHTLIKFLLACPKDAWFDWDLRNLEARSSLVTSLKVFMVWQGTLSLWGLLSLRVDEHCIVTWCSMLLTSVSDSLNDDELRGDIDESVSVGWREKIICMSRILSVDRSVFVYKLIQHSTATSTSFLSVSRWRRPMKPDRGTSHLSAQCWEVSQPGRQCSGFCTDIRSTRLETISHLSQMHHYKTACHQPMNTTLHNEYSYGLDQDVFDQRQHQRDWDVFGTWS